ncbi:hypothetical protein DFJ58DRAFT_841101 [Suillus subalutaceus]|uniref:uncharacterized protein n=1 Tax=Suillus subalutaceus TaxID=48586 RepID=UPI001B87BBF6|nr:uncharacterized protein DFJ58DRAFT_841101 [Suillus subalutaceus]KAG1855677.1 hypothetical protein DFJ58DRAFT_841101 [Suillus subalutaceus]
MPMPWLCVELTGGIMQSLLAAPLAHLLSSKTPLVPLSRGKEDTPIKFTDKGGGISRSTIPPHLDLHVMHTTVTALTGQSLAEHRSGFSGSDILGTWGAVVEISG